ncbi:MAG: hypothetical protein NVSMB21_00020 [Vulcanimicrobiaceae bacterium]
MSLLEVDDLRAGYGRIEILHGISLRLAARELCAIVGANGAGKTTLLMAISRLVPARSGSIRFDGRDVTRAPSHAVVRAGISHVPEGRRMLAGMSVEENLQVALARRRDLDERAEIAAAYERFPVLGTRRKVPAGSLSGGEQQMLALARALERRLSLEAGAIEVVPHGVAVPLETAPLVRPPDRPGPIVGWRGYLSADRSWETAIDAFGRLRETHPNARMEVAGSGRARNFVVAHARHAKLSGVVNFRGDVPAAELFANIDVLAVPISNDAQPQAPLEALVAGIPVVAAMATALRDAIEPLETGWLVPDDTAGFVEGLGDAWRSIDRAWSGAAAQRGAARERYGREVVGARYRAIYDAVLARASPP